MKKIILILTALFLCISLFSCTSEGEAHMGFKIISTDVNDFRLEVPSEWTVTSQNGFVSATANGLDGDESNVSVMSTVLNGTLTTEAEYFDALLVSYGEMYKDVEVESRDVDVDFGDGKGKKYVFTATVLGDEYRFMHVLRVRNDRLYIFTYTSNEEFYAEHELEVEYVISYFEFKV